MVHMHYALWLGLSVRDNDREAEDDRVGVRFFNKRAAPSRSESAWRPSFACISAVDAEQTPANTTAAATTHITRRESDINDCITIVHAEMTECTHVDGTRSSHFGYCRQH